MALQLPGPNSTTAAIFESRGDSYVGKTLLRSPVQPIPIERVENGNEAANLLSFLEFPPEIRVDIYKLLLVSHSSISFFQRYDHTTGASCGCCGDLPLSPLRRARKAGVPPDIHTQILHTCRQVHAETASILYRDNKFLFPCPKDLERFSRDIRSVNAASLRNISADHSAFDCSIHYFWFFHTQTAVSSTPGLAEFSANFVVRWNHRTPSLFMDALVCMNLILQTHPRLRKLVLRRQLVHVEPTRNTDIITLVLVSENYKLKPGRRFEVAVNGCPTELNHESRDEILVDIDAELAILRKPRERPWQVGAGSIFL